MYEDVKNEVKQSLIEADRVAITTDGWTSCSTEGSCEMLERFLEQQAAVEATLMSKDFRKGEEANTLKDCDISNAEDVVQLMTPIKMATTVMCEEQQPTVSVIAPLKAKLLSHLKPNEDDSAIVKEMKNVMVKDLSDRYSDVNDSLYKVPPASLQHSQLWPDLPAPLPRREPAHQHPPLPSLRTAGDVSPSPTQSPLNFHSALSGFLDPSWTPPSPTVI
ncbi:hypothetical protein SKAU_G00059550 [Synaphobranchus kaupii]|uniref:Uncharacterized protein n=1 Tax=Synaphobranchus kaupii TaxID=118154 RepID=A0A9Q1JAK8_SYNKA|nr:hypothetical protein SKAU_G00059550 [Synaphobranchus kaupii]